MALKYRIFLSVVTFLAVFFLASCTDDLMYDSASSSLELDESDIIDAKLSVSVNNFKVSTDGSTRSEEPTDEKEIMTDFEKQVDNICVFQFDVNGNLLIKPRYYTAEGSYDSTSDNWNVVLKPNIKSKIYVVANVAQGDTWVEKYENFSTENALLSATLPEPFTIYEFETDLEGHIPAKGYVDEITVTYNSEITIPVEHMYAKVKVRVYLDKAIEQYDPSVGYVTFTNSPFYCKVGTLYDGEAETSQEEKYPSNTVWNEYPLSTDGVGNNDGTNDPNNKDLPDDELPYDYVIYVPENIQGEHDADNNDDTKNVIGKNITHASYIVVALNYTNSDGVNSQKLYNVYPGGNNTNNFNIRRNQVYRVTVRLGYPIEEEYSPSANCIVGHPGTTISFEPYYRVETGGGYDFSTYLDPTDDQKTIKGYKILWQTENCIGDNSKGDLVTFEQDEAEPIHSKFYVKVNQPGNAVIAAYNNEECSGDILWSWHIWVTSEDPTNIGNAVVYYTYEWDASTIYGESSGHSRVPGYGVMPCNLGALSSTPASDAAADKVATYGLLYQWGRKDPFPALKTRSKDGVNGDFYDYTEETTENLYNNEHKRITGMTADTDEYCLFHSVTGTTIKNNNYGVDFTIKNPTVFMCGTNLANQKTSTYVGISSENTSALEETIANYTFQGDWMADHDEKLWGAIPIADATISLQVATDSRGDQIHLRNTYGTKSIYDPCPYGWRVSPPDQWLGFTETGKNPSAYSAINTSDGGESGNNAHYGMYLYIQAWKQGAQSYFPVQGTRCPDGSYLRPNRCGNYHNATSDPSDTFQRVNILHVHNNTNFHIFEGTYVTYYNKATAGSIRCVRDKK